jgi:hypothetical protein
MLLKDQIQLYHNWIKAKREGQTREEFSKSVGKSSVAIKSIITRLKKTVSVNYDLDRVIELITSCSIMLGVLPQDLTPKLIKECYQDDKDGYELFWNDAKKYGGLAKIVEAHFPVVNTKAAGVKLVNQKTALLNKKDNRKVLEMDMLQESVEEWSERVFKGKFSPPFHQPKSNKNTSRCLTLVLSDLHFGSDVLKEETGVLDYGKIEESRRIAKIVYETIEYKKQHRKDTSLNVLFLGDLIQNQLHDARDGAVLAEQVCRAIYLLTQVVHRLSQEFPSVTVYANTGNHGRYTSRHHNRATNQKWDSHETVITYAVKNACSSLKNVSFVIPKTAFVNYEMFGQKIFATHGDTALNTGFPGSSINVKSLETQINKINASLSDTQEYKVFICGHVHTGAVVHLNNGSTLITNGALIPSDQYATSIGIFETKCGQWLFETIAGYPVGDSRFLQVDSSTDKDASMDKIITPFVGFNS